MLTVFVVLINAFVAGYFYAAYKDTGTFMTFAFFFMNAFMTLFNIMMIANST